MAPQWIGDGQPSTPGVNLICSNPAGVSLLSDITTGDLSVLSDVDTQLFSITASGNIFVMSGSNFSPRQVNLVGANEQQVSAFGGTIGNLTVNKSANNVSLTSQLNLRGKLLIESANTDLHANGHLVLLSTSDDIGGTASVGPLPPGSSVTGDVTVQRHMAGEGRIFRYISSPVQNATVASLQDDFPVTGTFVDPSGSTNPSFFYYDQSVGGLVGGWQPYPTSGLASANPLLVGKGYAARIRKTSGPTVWDVTGPLNQGTIVLPIDFSPNNQPSNGWNLVGNPYACAIQWDEEGQDKWSMENVSSVIAIRDNGSAGGTFRYWDLDNNYSEEAGGQIASGQSFWVRATGQGASLTIREGVKTPEGAVFYRAGGAPIPSFAVSLSNAAMTDVAYFKIRPSASSRLDDWDGIKMDNAQFDLSFVTVDNISLAIHATNRLPCDTIVQLKMKDLTAGQYSFKLSAKYHFTRYSFSLLDNFQKTETMLDPDVPVSIVVTSNPASFAAARFSLRLKENAPRNDLQVTVAPSACEDEVVGVKITGAESGVTYSIYASDSTFFSSGSNDTNGDLVISFRASALMPGENTLSVKAHATCHAVPLPGTHAIIRESTPQIWGDPVTACSGSTITLEASSDTEDARFFWFDEFDRKDTIGFESTFRTEPLVKSKVYYVVAVADGCASAPLGIKATIINYKPAEITVGDTVLVSNYAFNNVWMLNGDTLRDARDRYVALNSAGTYAVIADTLGCQSRASYDYFPLEAEPLSSELYAYPNPVSDVLALGNAGQTDGLLHIVDSQGRVVLQGSKMLAGGNEQMISVRDLAKGIYFVLVRTPGRKRIIRFIKED